MSTSIPQPPLAPEAPFRYVGGEPALDLVNTADWTERGLERDRITDYARLLEWAEGSGVLPGTTAEALRRAAQADPRGARTAHAAALRLRDVIHRLFSAVAEGRSPGGALDELNVLVAAAGRRMRLAPEGAGWARTWDGWGEALDSPLWPVVWSAVRLLSEEAERVRVCAGEDCGWIYVDRSRNGFRRWCEMQTCGTTAKNRRRATRAGGSRAPSGGSGAGA
jgi:predicted RNA-binding Zn ribbon-like protein